MARRKTVSPQFRRRRPFGYYGVGGEGPSTDFEILGTLLSSIVSGVAFVKHGNLRMQ